MHAYMPARPVSFFSLYSSPPLSERPVRARDLQEVEVVHRRAYSFIINHAYRSADTSMNNWQSGPNVNGSFLLNQLRAIASLADGYQRDPPSLSLYLSLLLLWTLSKKLFHSHLISTIIIICTPFFRLAVRNEPARAEENVENFISIEPSRLRAQSHVLRSKVNLGIYILCIQVAHPACWRSRELVQARTRTHAIRDAKRRSKLQINFMRSRLTWNKNADDDPTPPHLPSNGGTSPISLVIT